MKKQIISADGHLDLFYLPPDTFTSRTSSRLKDKVRKLSRLTGFPRGSGMEQSWESIAVGWDGVN